MPNRFLKESICTSETLERLTAEEERFFYRLLVQCDDYGRFDGRSSVIMGRCFPLKLESGTIHVSDIERWLSALSHAGLVTLYTVNGVRYLQVSTWEKHQQVRAIRSKFPDPMEGEIAGTRLITTDSKSNQEKSSDSTGEQMSPYSYSNNDIRNTNTSIENNVGSSEPTTETSTPKSSKTEEYTEEFLAFWDEYPRKVDKKGAVKTWKVQKRKGTNIADLMTAARHYAAAVAGKQQEYILHPSTFLGPNDRWRDYLDPVTQFQTPAQGRKGSNVFLQRDKNSADEYDYVMDPFGERKPPAKE